MKKRIRERERFAFAENKRMERKRGIFSYSLILLFSALGAAQGAKLCFNLNAPQTPLAASSWTDLQLDTTGIFRLGGTCGNNGACTAEPGLIGVSRCGTSQTAYGASSNLITSPKINNPMTTAFCFCQLTYPFKGPTVYAGTMLNTSGPYANEVCEWGDHCAELCRSKSMGDAAFFNQLLGKA
ncbi:MAG: hypothetical protein LBL46_02830 [Rickettsiales bacterium]|nr:hypothetical protein [Rickettsiales bacterium]